MTELQTATIDCQSAAFGEVLRLRALAYGTSRAGRGDPIDDHSYHFVARQAGRIIGALRVTCRRDGPLESQDAYPAWLLREFGDRLCGSSRMCVAPETRRDGSVAVALTRHAWRTVLPRGIRIDVSKVRLDATAFYARLGYALVRDSVFEFGAWRCRCALLAYGAAPGQAGRLGDLFTGVAEPCVLAASPHADRFTTSPKELRALRRAWADIPLDRKAIA